MSDDMPKTIAAWRFHINKADEWLHGGWSLDHDHKTVSYTRTSELEALRAENEQLNKSCFEWAKVSQQNYQRAKTAEAEIARLQYALATLNNNIQIE